jgi:hypothetical protein
MSVNLCSSIGGNTGGVACDAKRGVPRKVLLGGKQFTSAEYSDPATLQAAIMAAINLPNGDSNKLYPLPEVLEVAVNTEADTMGNLALGAPKRLRKGRHAYTYSVEIGHYQYQRLLAFDGKYVNAFTFDDSSNMWGSRAKPATANTPNTLPWKGESIYFTISGNGFGDGANATTGVATIMVSYQSIDEFEKSSAYASLPDLSSSDLEGLKDVMLTKISNASNVYKIGMIIPLPKLGGDLNIFDDYGAAIAALTFTAGTGANYATALTITSVAVDNTLKALTVTFDSTAYTALPANTKIRLSGPGVAALVGASVTGIEIGSIILVK